jgi:hypothetical protein
VSPACCAAREPGRQRGAVTCCARRRPPPPRQAHPSFYESVPGGLLEVRQRVEALQRKFNEESKVRPGGLHGAPPLLDSQTLLGPPAPGSAH